MRKLGLIVLFFLILNALVLCSSITLSLTRGDWIELTGAYKLPGAYIHEGKTFWRIDGHFEKTSFNYNDLRITIESPETIGDDATVLFVDAGKGEKSTWSYLKNLLDGAKRFVYVCIYNIDYRPFTAELKNLRKKGIDVKVITELDNRNTLCDELNAVYDKNSKLMHNKFIVVDGYAVVTGSLNFTENGFRKNNNNVVVFYSNELAQEYMNEFQEMLDGTFGSGTFEPILVRTDFGTVFPVFTPDDSLATQRIIDMINRATKSVHMMMFTFTSKNIAGALLRAKERGIDVRVILEEFQAYNKWSVYNFLKDNGIPVILDKNPYVFHHKVLIVDGKYTITGSFNYTNSAQRYNDENFLIIKDSVLSKAFEKKFEYYWQSWTK